MFFILSFATKHAFHNGNNKQYHPLHQQHHQQHHQQYVYNQLSTLNSQLNSYQPIHIHTLSLFTFYISASSSTSCQDDPTFQLSVSTDRDEHCTWIDIDANDTTFRRNEQCVSPKKQYIIDACPRACGVCCGDNPTFQFALHDIDKEEPIDNSEVSCAWLASSIPTQVEKDYYCIEKKIKYSCPSSCGICPTLSPTMSPTVYSSVAPSESPRVTMEVYYAAELYTSQILSDGNAVKDGMNTFFSMNRAVLASMDEEGIEDITFKTFLVNGAIEDIDSKLVFTHASFLTLTNQSS